MINNKKRPKIVCLALLVAISAALGMFFMRPATASAATGQTYYLDLKMSEMTPGRYNNATLSGRDSIITMLENNAFGITIRFTDGTSLKFTEYLNFTYTVNLRTMTSGTQVYVFDLVFADYSVLLSQTDYNTLNSKTVQRINFTLSSSGVDWPMYKAQDVYELGNSNYVPGTDITITLRQGGQAEITYYTMTVALSGINLYGDINTPFMTSPLRLAILTASAAEGVSDVVLEARPKVTYTELTYQQTIFKKGKYYKFNIADVVVNVPGGYVDRLSSGILQLQLNYDTYYLTLSRGGSKDIPVSIITIKETAQRAEQPPSEYEKKPGDGGGSWFGGIQIPDWVLKVPRSIGGAIGSFARNTVDFFRNLPGTTWPELPDCSAACSKACTSANLFFIAVIAVAAIIYIRRRGGSGK